MKKIMFVLLLMVLLLSYNVKADEYFYTNTNGVNFTKEEYDFITDFYFEGYQNDMTQSELNIIREFVGAEINTVEYDDIIYAPQGTVTLETTYKQFALTSACSGNKCIMNSTLDWKLLPATRSYDVMGMYYTGGFTSGSIQTKVYNGSTLLNTYLSPKIFVNGFGQSFKLPTGSNLDLGIIQTYTVTKGSTIRASYQHAQASVTLNQSKSYTLSTGGLGGVFNHNYGSYYDGMQGLTMSL